VCDFCGCDLPDWKSSLTPETGAQAPAIMNVNFGGTTYSFEVKPGPEVRSRAACALLLLLLLLLLPL